LDKNCLHFILRNNKLTLFFTLFIAIAGFTIFFLDLQQQGLKTRTERLYYLPFQLFQEERTKQAEARVPLRMSVREVESGIFEHTLEIQSSSGENFAQMTELGLDLSAPSEWKLISADITFYEAEGNQAAIKFATQEQKKQKKENSSIVLSVVSASPQNNLIPQKGLLVIRAAAARELSIWSQKSAERPVSSILWTLMPNTEEKNGEANYASLDGWFRYNEVGVPDYSKAKLLAHMWGFGVDGERIIYQLCVLALLLWILGLVLMLGPQILLKVIPDYLSNAMGCSLLFMSICIVFAFIFPPFHGPDEVHHFSGYVETSGQGYLVSKSLEIANLGSFQRIHRKKAEKFTSIDVAIKNQAEWPPDTTRPYFAGRSPLGTAIWKGVKGFINAHNAGLAMLQLRVINGLFVGLCLLLALAVAGSIFPTKNLATWYCAPLLLIPCIAHFSTVVSNYPFLIGGYAIQMVVLGVMWASFDRAIIGVGQLVKIGLLLGVGIGVAICSADNAMAALPFWGLILPGFLAARRIADRSKQLLMRETKALLGSACGSLILFCAVIGAFSKSQCFLPGMVAAKLNQVLPIGGNDIVAGIVLIVTFFVVIGFGIGALFFVSNIVQVLFLRIPWRAVWGILVILAAIIMSTYNIRIPEINLSRGGDTDILKYSFSVVIAFFDGFLPGSVDPRVVNSFWRRLAWHDTFLPEFLMEFLRLSMGLGILLIMWKSIAKNSVHGIALFYAMNLVALVMCVATIGALYYVVQYNVNSRYILICYMMAAILSVEGYRRVYAGISDLACQKDLAFIIICISALGIQICSYITILDRYF
jgi:hypothetical protein